MKVTAILPTFNHADLIDLAVKSVVDQVDELVIVNDGSTDKTASKVDAYNARWDHVLVHHHESNKGAAAAINSGFEIAKLGSPDLVTWVSSDNAHTTTWAETLVKAFTPETGLVYSAFETMGARRVVHRDPYPPGGVIESLNCIIGPSFMVRTEVWQRAGDHRGELCHDYDHALRLEEACWALGLSLTDVPDVLCAYRVHDNSSTARSKHLATARSKHLYDAHRWRDAAARRRKTKPKRRVRR